MESVNGPKVLPICYKEYYDVFGKKNKNMFLQYRLYDCAIDLQENTQLPFGPQSILYLKTNLLPFKNTLMKILPRISFDIPSL
jgi:hypothetical protein